MDNPQKPSMLQRFLRTYPAEWLASEAQIAAAKQQADSLRAQIMAQFRAKQHKD